MRWLPHAKRHRKALPCTQLRLIIMRSKGMFIKEPDCVPQTLRQPCAPRLPGIALSMPTKRSATAEAADSGSMRRWGLCLMAMATLHGAALTIAMNGATASFPPPPPPQAAVTIELAPLQPPPPAPQAKPEPKKPPRQEVRSTTPKAVKPKPIQKQALPSPTQAAALSVPVPQPSHQTELPAEEAVREAPPVPVQSVAIPNWQGELQAHLEQHKRYPRTARMRHQEGMAVVRFVMDREGRIISVKLERASGAETLDEESLALLDRAQPLPPPPEEVSGNRIEVIVPVQFQLR